MTTLVQPIRMSGITRNVRWWALSGVVGALCGIGGVAFMDTERTLTDQDLGLRLCGAFGLVAVAGVIVFMGGLRSYLDAQTPAGSLTGPVVQAGGMMTATILLASFLLKLIVADNIANLNGDADPLLRNALDELSTGAWVGLVVVMFSVAAAAIGNAALPSWLGWLSLPLGGLIAIASVVGARRATAAFLPGVAWVAVVGVAMARKS